MKRILLSIGVNQYDFCDDLAGSENDAELIYEAMVNSEYSSYDKDKSSLLLSPTYQEFQSKLEKTIFDNVPVDVLTIYFSGHGTVSRGSYYLGMKDTLGNRLAISAFNLSQLFVILSDADVKQVNIIVDSCNSGGVVNDLGAILKPEVIGESGSLSVSYLAASGSNEGAQEVNGIGGSNKRTSVFS